MILRYSFKWMMTTLYGRISAKRKLPKEIADSKEGDLTMEELQEALFKHMNGNSSPGMDGFTVNYLRAFWPSLKFITKEALNAIQKDGLSQTLRGAILKLLWKGEKDPLEFCIFIEADWPHSTIL